MIINSYRYASAAYDPLMMSYDGSTGLYHKTYTPSGNKGTKVGKFNLASVAATQYLFVAYAYNGSIYIGRCVVHIFANNHATTTRRRKLAFTVSNSSNAVVCRTFSVANIDDSTDHAYFCAYDGDAGTAIMYIDGADAMDTGNPEHNITTGTLTAGNAGSFLCAGGLWNGASGSGFANGELGYDGYREAYLTNPTDFYHPTNGLQELDTSGWTEFGGVQPLVFAPNGKLDTNNLGSAGAFTKVGTISGPA